jgi:hypothetical protein
MFPALKAWISFGFSWIVREEGVLFDEDGEQFEREGEVAGQ